MSGTAGRRSTSGAPVKISSATYWQVSGAAGAGVWRAGQNIVKKLLATVRRIFAGVRRRAPRQPRITLRERKTGALQKPSLCFETYLLDYYKKTEGYLLQKRIPSVSSIMLSTTFDFFKVHHSYPLLDSAFCKAHLLWRCSKQCMKRANSSSLKAKRHLSFRQGLSVNYQDE